MLGFAYALASSAVGVCASMLQVDSSFVKTASAKGSRLVSSSLSWFAADLTGDSASEVIGRQQCVAQLAATSTF